MTLKSTTYRSNTFFRSWGPGAAAIDPHRHDDSSIGCGFLESSLSDVVTLRNLVNLIGVGNLCTGFFLLAFYSNHASCCEYCCIEELGDLFDTSWH